MKQQHKAPELSIIVPVYKVEKYLDECIQSILHQTFTDFELILVDDGSPDACPQMCDAAAEQDSRVRVIHQKNGGLSAARNAGIEAARGSWLGFIDSDDFVAPDFYEKLYNAAVSANADCAVCGVAYVDEQGKPMKNYRVDIEAAVVSGTELLQRWANTRSVAYIIAPNKLYRRKCFETLRYPVGKLNEDMFVFAPLMGDMNWVSCLSEELYFYRQHGSSIMNTAKTCRNLSQIEAFGKCFEYLVEHGLDDLLVPTEKIMFAQLTEIYYKLPDTEKHKPEVKKAKSIQRQAARALQKRGLLSARTAFRTVLFQCFPLIYQLRRAV